MHFVSQFSWDRGSKVSMNLSGWYFIGVKMKSSYNIKVLLKFEPLYTNGIGSDQDKALRYFLIKGSAIIKERGLGKE